MSTATVVVHVTEAQTGADLAGLQVLANPGGLQVVTNASGRASFASLPFGVYSFAVTTTAIRVVGANLVAGPPVEGRLEGVSLVAGATVPLRLAVSRIDREGINLVRIHSPQGGFFSPANCIVCHGDRKSELSADPAKKPFHAMGNANAGHSSKSCVFCHQGVDLQESSGASLRKQVAVDKTCTLCHANYPASY